MELAIKRIKSSGIFKIMNEKLRFTSIFLISGLLFNIILCFSLFTINSIEVYVVELFGFLLIINGSSEIFFAVLNKIKLDSWGLLLQSGTFTIITGVLILFNLVNILNMNEVFLSYFLVGAIFNLVLASSLDRYGMIDWSSFKNLNWAVISLSVTAFIFLINDLADTDILLAFISIFYGCGRMILFFKFSELNTFSDKVSRQIYKKIDGVKKEYFEALEKNWDAGRNLFL